MEETFRSFYKTVEGGEGDRCNYRTRLDMYGRGCQHNCAYCVHPDTPVLMYNGTQKPIKDVQIGDEIYGYTEDNKLVRNIVLNKWNTHKKAYRITLQDGTELICSGDHRWLSNRGWKYTTGSMSGDNQRPYLTTSNFIIGVNTGNQSSPQETEMYRRGYISGVIRGDANFKVYEYDREYKHDVQYHFRLALKEESITKRVATYLNQFGIETNAFRFDMGIDRATSEQYDVYAIRTSSKAYFDRIKELIEYSDDSEYRRGFVAGFYDAEGYRNDITFRVYNTDADMIRFFEESIKSFGYDCVYDKDKKMESGKILKTLRIKEHLGGRIRFQSQFQTEILKGIFDGTMVKSERTGHKIVSIEPLGEMDLIDITTQTENFIADGCVSHNCYARYLLDFRGNWNNETPAIADRKEVLKTLDTIPEGSFLRLGGMTDPFQPIESQYHHTEWLIGELNDRKINYLIVTKGSSVADCKEISPIYGHVQMSITHTHEPPVKDFEFASPWEDRLKAIETINDRGIDAQIRLSPMIPGFIDPEIILQSKVDKVLVEFLRVNTFIKRSMHSQFKPWTEQAGAYYHLPLGKKITMLKPYFGKKRLTICEDHPEHYEYFLHNINANPMDCCDLRINNH